MLQISRGCIFHLRGGIGSLPLVFQSLKGKVSYSIQSSLVVCLIKDKFFVGVSTSKAAENDVSFEQI